MTRGLTRPLSLVAAFCLTAALFSGCAKNQANHGLDPDAPTTIAIWHYYNGVQQEHFDKLLLEFNETVGRDMGIVVEGYNKNTVNDLSESAIAALRGDPGAETPPDMFAAYSGAAYTADQLGALVDLTEYFTSEELDEYVTGYLEEGDLQNNGELKIMPIAKSTEVMMLNLTDWNAFSEADGASLDDLSTWEGVARTAERYYAYTDALTPDVPNDGKAFFGRDAVANYMIVGAKQMGLEFFTLDGGTLSMHTDKEVVRRLWDCYYAPYVKGYYFSNGRFRSDDAQVGEIIALVCSTTGCTYFPQFVTLDDEHVYPIDSLVLPTPCFQGAKPYLVQQGAGIAVVKSEEKKEYACSVFLKWFTQTEQSIAFSANSGYLPVKKEANDFGAISSSFSAEENGANSILLDVIKVAVSEIKTYEMYASKPFDTAEETRDFLEEFIQNSAQAAHDEAAARISSGEERDAVLEEYLSDSAFDAWYEEFVSGLQAAAGI